MVDVDTAVKKSSASYYRLPVCVASLHNHYSITKQSQWQSEVQLYQFKLGRPTNTLAQLDPGGSLALSRPRTI